MSYHHQCHCHSTPPTPTPTCHCTMCYTTTTHYSSPPPQPPNPPLQYPQTHHHAPPQAHIHAPPHTHLHAPPQNNLHPPPQTHLYQENRKLSLNDPTVSSLIHRISALETSLRRRSKHSLRDAAARTIQTHFRTFLVRRSVTLRNLKDLAFIKSSLNKLKSSVSNKPHFDSYLISRQSLNLLIKLDSIQGSDSMIRDGKRSITRELIKFMDLIDEICMESPLISVKNVRFNKKNGVVLQAEKKIRVSSENEKKISEILKNRIRNKNRIEGLLKSEPKTKKNVRFDENGNVYRLIERKNSHVSSSDGSEEEEEEEVVEEIGVSSKEMEVEVENEKEDESSLEMSENEMDPRKNLQTRIDDLTKKIQLSQKCDDEEEDEADDDGDDSFVFSAPLPAKMEYRVDSTSKKQTAKQ
uniref:BAG family molecular chaperone regulator 8, chloroplastic n=1 Tax=Erigeron canadensis TaxID=72917 RepID=UPI001CB9003C|nr:BAG family molecular chaperone regulator 8, chloroplastic [Erigeron canadensis]